MSVNEILLRCVADDNAMPTAGREAARWSLAEIARLREQRDKLREACQMVLSRWAFDNHQQHRHTWHDMQDCATVIRAALAGDGHAP